MLSLILCSVAFLAGLLVSRRSLVAGIGTVLTVGYAYGIVRANLTQPASHFIFDAAVLGLYCTQLPRSFVPGSRQLLGPLSVWVAVLIAWPVLLLAIPRQDALVQLVGLRGNVFLVPFLLLGARLTDERAHRLALWCAVLNIVVFLVAAAEYQLGIQPFFPKNAVTAIIYASNDATGLGYGVHRIPATFSSAHAYGGTMVATLPLLIGAWVEGRRRGWRNPILISAIIASIIGIFMCAARSPAIILFVMLGIVAFSLRMRLFVRFVWVVMLLGVGWFVAGDVRLQRFATLGDVGAVEERVVGSVNTSFFDLMGMYPLGNGLGGGGTSIPYFLQSRIDNQVLMESEYARILLEQGVPGLMLWAAFIVWTLSRAIVDLRRGTLGRRLFLCFSALSFVTGFIGVGLLTSIPQTSLLLLGTGWLVTRPQREWQEHAAPDRIRAGARDAPSDEPTVGLA